MAEEKKNKKKSGKKSKENKKGLKEDTEKVCETFEIEKDGKTTEVEACGEMKKEHLSSEELKKQNDLLKNIFIFFGIVLVVVAIWWAWMYYSSLPIEYKGLEFNKVQAGDILFYHTFFNIKDNGLVKHKQNVYLRHNPKNTGQIPFEGDLRVYKMWVVDIAEEIQSTNEAISIGNMIQTFEPLGVTVAKDPNATCDDQEEARYGYLKFIQGEETKITEVSDGCYEITLKNDDDILITTERFIIDSIARIYGNA